ncbi:MAG: hypothetical protein J6C52_04505, partial [Clostridia bacterium]|nr:hypothetical protein [Clostridia bacterium]
YFPSSLVVQFSRTIACLPLVHATYLLYHISLRLSRGFAKVFKFFLKLFCSAVPWLRLAATFILYHIFKRLSSGFEKVF